MKNNYVIANWKMNHTSKDVFNFIQALKGKAPFKCQSWIAPQSLHLYLLKEFSKMHGIEVGAQNCSQYESGAYTGEISPMALKELGASFTLVGHSERRQLFAEDDEIIRSKIQIALKLGLKVVLCIGETLEQRQKDKTQQVLERQIASAIKKLNVSNQHLLVAYEPIWAIGTGKTATPSLAQEAHAFIRQQLKLILGQEGSRLPILYGGSVKPNNFEELLACQDIDGGLVGGASLEAESYAQLCQIASNKHGLS